MDFDGITNAKTMFATAMQKQAANAAAQAGGANAQKVKKTAQQFEAFFVGSMMESMTADMEPDEVFGGGHGEEMWRSMLNQEYGKEVAKNGRLGIADSVSKAMLKMQEERTKAAQTAGQDVSALPATTSADFKSLQNAATYMPVNAQAAAAYMSLNTGASTFRPVKGH